MDQFKIITDNKLKGEFLRLHVKDHEKRKRISLAGWYCHLIAEGSESASNVSWEVFEQETGCLGA